MARRKKPSYDMFPGLFDQIEEQDSSNDPIMSVDATPESRSDRTRHGGMAARKNIPLPKTEITPLAAPKPTKAFKFISFGSGSSGNCAYLGDERFGILIDAGIDPDKVVGELKRNGIEMTRIGGIILTHDHGDHIRYAYTIVRRFQHLRIYCTPKTLNGILRRHNVSRRIKDYHQPIFKEFPFHLGNFVITPFEVSHDGSDNVGFSIALGDSKFVVATDMGVVTDRADHYIRGANHLMIESNYDRKMLIDGHYPEYLKARILAPDGHMDDEVTADYLSKIYTPGLHNIFLCHLSNDNNNPETAIAASTNALQRLGISVGDGSGSILSRDAQVQLMALPRFDITGVLVLK